MWAKNSTPSPGFLEGSLDQNTIQGTVERVDQGTTTVVLALRSDPLGPSSHSRGLTLDKCTGQLGEGGQAYIPCEVNPRVPTRPLWGAPVCLCSQVPAPSSGGRMGTPAPA